MTNQKSINRRCSAKLSDDEVFISNPEKCSVVLSGKFFPLNSTCKVDIDGVFIAGNTMKQFRIKMQFGERPGVFAKTFSKGDFPVSFAK